VVPPLFPAKEENEISNKEETPFPKQTQEKLL
jgi:hypothetical protein